MQLTDAFYFLANNTFKYLDRDETIFIKLPKQVYTKLAFELSEKQRISCIRSEGYESAKERAYISIGSLRIHKGWEETVNPQLVDALNKGDWDL